MEKRYDPKKKDGEPDKHVAHDLDNKSLRLFRSAVQTAQRLDIQLKSANTWQEVFSPDVVLRRQRLRENCEHLLFTYPEQYGRKAEELLWRKVFYDLIQKLKQFRKKGDEECELRCTYRSHLSSAAAFYFHLLVSFQNTCDLNFQGYFDWIPVMSSLDRVNDQAKVSKSNEWIMKACQRTLIYLGDLARYQQEFDGDLSTELAERFYHQAIYVNPDLGMPHNQLGTLFWNHNYGCRAAYYYMRCLMSGSPFEGTEGNLMRLFEENHSNLQQLQQSLVAEMAESKVRLTATSRFLTQFLYLQEIFYKSISLSAEDYQRLCNFILQELDMALNHTHDKQTRNKKGANGGASKKDTEKDLQKEENDENDKGDLLEGRTLLEVTALLIMSMTRMKIKGASLVQDAFLFFMKFTCEILRNCISNIEAAHLADITMKLPHPGTNGLVQNGYVSRDTKDNAGHDDEERIMKAKHLRKRLLTQRRRRRRRQSSTLSDGDGGSDNDVDESRGDESDLSEGELAELLNETMSEDEDDSNVSSMSDDDTDGTVLKSGNVLMNGGTNMKENTCKSVRPSEHHLITSLVKEELLMVIKLCIDWLRANPDSTNREGSAAMFTQLAGFLNILPKQEELFRIAKSKGNVLKDIVDKNVDKDWVQTKALREDIALLGFTPLAKIHGRLDISWNRNIKYRKLLETVVRLQSIKAGAALLASLEAPCLEYDSISDLYSVCSHGATNGDVETEDTSTKEDNQRRAKLMKTMAQQRLQSEVADLESKVKSQSHSPSPYLIPDAPTLCTQLHIIRQLIATKNFVVIVPIQVVSALDELKKFNPGAREAIKYLEQELKKGNRWIRAQKESESVSRSQKRAKQEEISVWRFSQVVNCCLHFINLSGSGMVTLLTDDSDIDSLKKRPSRGNAAIAVGTKASAPAVELAMKNSVNVQSIKSFRAKWVAKNSVT